MLLQFIIIHYDEPIDYLLRTLNMLAMQQSIDFSEIGVLIENDGDKNVLDISSLPSYPFNIKYTVNPWTGRSGVRQFGIEHASADYIMFCDFDDMFLRFDALLSIFNAIKKSKPNKIRTTFISDHVINTDRDYSFSSYLENNVWIHGKIFDRHFIVNNNIKWNTTLNEFEDSYFCRLFDAYSPTIIDISEPTYWWATREGSATRNDKSRAMLDYLNKGRSASLLIDELFSRNITNFATAYLLSFVYEFYFIYCSILNKEELSQDYTDHLDESCAQYLRVYNKYKSIITSNKLDTTRIKIVDALRRRFFFDYNRVALDPITFKDFINTLENKYA